MSNVNPVDEKPAKDRSAVLAEREAKKLAKKLKATKLTKDESKPTTIKNETKPAKIIKDEIKPTKIIKDEAIKTAPKKEVKPLETESKSNAELKAERRAKQEAQRAAKLAQKQPIKPEIKQSKEPEKPTISSKPKKQIENVVQHKAQLLFNHLLIERETAKLTFEGIHESIRRVGIQYQAGIVLGSNARCVAMLTAIKQMILDFKTPGNKEYARSLDTALQKSSQYLHSCRPVSVSMTNALRFLKYQITHLSNEITEEEAAASLCEAINTYIREQIEMAGEAISIAVQAKIENGDVILTYGCSSLIQNILLGAHESGKKFRVIVVDGRPLMEGREMLRRLVAAGIKCTYSLIATTSFIMASVNKVLLGAHALLANGYVMSRCGTAQIALMAKAHNVSVLVCCETYKFCERVQTDSFVYNEIGKFY